VPKIDWYAVCYVANSVPNAASNTPQQWHDKMSGAPARLPIWQSIAILKKNKKNKKTPVE
jgi:hypothetical protein